MDSARVKGGKGEDGGGMGDTGRVGGREGGREGGGCGVVMAAAARCGGATVTGERPGQS